MLQTYTFYSEVPHKTVYTIIIATQLIILNPRRRGFHFYADLNPNTFRYPDKELLNLYHTFSSRDLDFIALITTGLGSEQIVRQLSLSLNTINTRQRNISKKTKKSTLQSLKYKIA